jgi:hypothetical protein
MALPQEPRLEEPTSASSKKSEDRKLNGMIRWFVNLPLNNNEKQRETPAETRSNGVRRRQTNKVKPDQQSEEKARIAELERQLAKSQERVQQLEAATAQTNDDSISVMATTTEPIANDATKAVPATLDMSKTYPSPSANKEDDNQEDEVLMTSGYTEETELSLAKSDDEESLDQELDPETHISSWHGIALESAVSAGLISPDTEHHLQRPRIIPPSEVLAICEPESSEVDELDLKIKLEDAQLRAQAYRCKLEAAEDLVASLFRDMEMARRSTHTLVSRNVTLAGAIKGMRLDQEEHYISRSSLMKVCVYISPVFILWGGLEYFVSTIILVWVLLELEAAVDPAEDDDRHQRKKKKHHHAKKPEEKMVDPPIPPALHVDS